MGCAPSLDGSHSRFLYCRDPSAEDSPPCSSNHLLLAATSSTTQSTPCRPDREKTETSLFGCPDSQPRSKIGHLLYHPYQLKVLLIFPKHDALHDNWQRACQSRQHDVYAVKSEVEALKVKIEYGIDLIVIDGRASKSFNAEDVSRALKGDSNPFSCIHVAIVKKNTPERDSARIATLLAAGFNRVVTESVNVNMVQNELLQIERCEILMLQQQKAVSAVCAALDTCKDIVHITDTQHRIQYTNKACEQHLGYHTDELLGKTIWEVHGSEHHRQSCDFRPTDQRNYDIRSSDQYFHPPAIHKASTDLKNPDIRENKLNLDISEAVNMQMRRGKEWEGVVTCRRKSGDLVHLTSRVVPIGPLNRRNDFYVYTSDWQTEKTELHPRGSVKSVRKGSYDIRSVNSDESSGESERLGGVLSAPIERDKFTFSRPPARFDGFREGGFKSEASSVGKGSIMRRQSLARLHSVMVEAPITRVVNSIYAAQESSPAYVATALDKVLEILRSTELYNPQFIPDNHKPVPTDPVATDLLGALLSQGPKPLSSGRRSSNEQIVKQSQNPRPSLPAFQQASGAIRELLADHLSWNFDVIKLEKLSDSRPLVWLGMSLMCHYDVPATLGCDESTLQNWLTLIEANYHSRNSYHNSTHASDVLHCVAYMLQKETLKELVDGLDIAACLIAAVVHDVDHPGKNSQFLCNTNNELAILYNDLCVLESHHAAISFKLTSSDDRVNIMKVLDQDSFKVLRKNIIDMILATDMAKHFEHVNKFINMLDKCEVKSEDENSMDDSVAIDFSLVNTSENMSIVKRMMIKCADISNPLKPLHLCKDWAHRIANEYFNQTEEEKRRCIPVVMPQFDRATCSIPKSQIGFMDFFIFEMFEAWNELIPIPEMIVLLRENYQYWKVQEELERVEMSKGVTMQEVITENGNDENPHDDTDSHKDEVS